MAKKYERFKIHSGIANAKLEELIQSPVLRTMACTLSPFSMNSLRNVYDSLNLYLSEIQADFSYLMKIGVIDFLGRDSAYKTYFSMQYDSVCIVPSILLSILRDISKEESKDILEWIDEQRETRDWTLNRSRNSILQPFVRALLAFYQGGDWQSLMPWCIEASEQPEFNEEQCLKKVLTALLEDEVHIPFINALSPVMASKLRSIKTESFISMELIDEEQKFRLLYFDKEGQPLSDFDSAVYVLQNELLVNGNIDQLLKKYHDWPFMSQLLTAVKALHSGKTKPMIAWGSTMRTTELGALALKVPVITMWLCAALLMDNTKDALDLATKLYKKRGKKSKVELMYTLLEYKLKDEIEANTLYAFKENTANTPGGLLCFSLFALHFRMFIDKGLPQYVKSCEDSMQESRLRYMQMLFAAESEKLASQAEELQAATGMKPFLPKIERKEEWELRLERLIDKTTRRGKSKAQTIETPKKSNARVAYLLNMIYREVQPILQKTKDNGVTWSKGRNIALRSFAEGNVEGMTSFDHRISKLVNIYTSFTGSTEYALRGNRVIPALVGHPYVYTDDGSQQKIDVVLEPLQLYVTHDEKKGFEITTNVVCGLTIDEYYIDTSNKTTCRVVKVDREQLALITQLTSIGPLPAKAKDKLRTLLSNISHSMTVMSDLLDVPTKANKTKASPLTVVQLVPEDDWIRVSLFVKPLVDVPPYLVPGEGIESISGKIGGKIVQARRDLKAEKQNLEAVETVMKPYDDRALDSNVWLLDVEQTLTLLEKLGGMKEQACVEWPEGVKMKIVRQQIMPSDISLKVHKLSDWFAIDGEVRIDENTMLKVSQLLQQLKISKGRFIRLGDQEFVTLSQDLAKYLRNLARLNTDEKQVRISSFSVSLIEELEQAGINVEADKAYRSLLKRITEADTMTVKTPKGIQADLRDYQKEGFQWLSRLAHWGAGACLADDMGLGKTLQSIALLFAKRSEGASLVVVPASVLQNWQDEIDRFAPSLHTIVLNKNGEAREEVVNNAAANDVIITSYGLLVTEQELLASKQWNIIVLDEAHTIKNRETKMSKAAMTLKSSARIALTGTPLQNRLAEIWNIFQFLNPGLLGSYQQFYENFIAPIEKNEDRERQRLLKRIISPFMLRRTKSDVLSELPQKTEITVKVNLSNEERALYENLRQQAMLAVESGECNAIQALAELTRLRQAACNAQLIDPRITIGSSKAETFMQFVGNLHDNHHRALVFSQFTSHLALIRRQLDDAGVSYLYLDGSTPVKQRAALVNEFQTGDAPLFLISLKAGGLGLNLTAADYVIHLDPWWNPAIEDQASDRSYRIGQQKPVTVYRLIATNTIEEKILSMHRYKKSLADALLEGSDLSARMTREEILELLHEMR